MPSFTHASSVKARFPASGARGAASFARHQSRSRKDFLSGRAGWMVSYMPHVVGRPHHHHIIIHILVSHAGPRGRDNLRGRPRTGQKPAFLDLITDDDKEVGD